MNTTNQKLVRVSTYCSLGVAGFLTVLKFGAWCATGSVSLMASLIDSMFDGLSSLSLLLAVRQSQRRATKRFRFGYGKVEALAVLSQSVLISISIIWLMIESVGRILHPQPIQVVNIGIFVMMLTMLITFGLITFQRHVVGKTQSIAVRADCMHYSADFMINGAVLVSLLLAKVTNVYWIDGFAASGMGCCILFSLRKVTMDSIGILMDRELSPEFRSNIKEIATSHPQVQGVHDLRTRTSGDKKFVQLHLELDGNLTLIAAHKVAEEVERNILQNFPDCEVIMHQDPGGITERRDCFPE